MPAGTEAILATTVEALGDVLSTMFFSDAVPVECRHALEADAWERSIEADASPAAGEWTSARVRFSGAPSGELLLMLSPGLAVVFSASFLGIDEAEVTREAAGQVCCELSNMICGAILSRVHPDSLVALDAPELTAADFENRGRVHRGLHQCFAIPEGTLAINLSSDAW
ncbi:MAG TPA: chemotaxis protein CheX [Bryobacteraceae bacterium]|nr:chemotaxis protein CheX [Bryobacteraceae bacterium]